MKRYQIAGVEYTPTGVVIKCPMLEDPDGEWVPYDDAERLESALKTIAIWALHPDEDTLSQIHDRAMEALGE